MSPIPFDEYFLSRDIVAQHHAILSQSKVISQNAYRFCLAAFNLQIRLDRSQGPASMKKCVLDISYQNWGDPC